MRLGKFGHEPAGDRAGPLAIDPAVGRVQDRTAPPRAGDRDVSEAPLFLETGQPALVKRALRGEHTVFPADQEHVVEFQPLGGVDRHDCHFFGVVAGVVVHHQADVFEKIAERFVVIHRARQFGQVFQPPGRLGAFFGLQRSGVAAFVQDRADQFGRAGLAHELAPTRHIAAKAQQGVARARR